MTNELTILGWTLVLALVQIGLAGAMRTWETGIGYNMGPRDAPAPPMRPITARLQRAQANLFETLPLFAAAVLIAHVSGHFNADTVLGCQMFLAGRVLYLPLYAFGVPVLRTIAWGVSLAGLIMVIKAFL